MADGGYAPKRGSGGDSLPSNSNNDGNGRQVGEDFPMLCETCLGENPYVRMVKLPFGNKACKVSGVPFQPFRWKAGPHGRYKETIVCFAVARERNLCQACLNDLTFGVPVGLRDHMLQKASQTLGTDAASMALPQSDVGLRYYYESRAADSGAEAQPALTAELHNSIGLRQLEAFSQHQYGQGSGSGYDSVVAKSGGTQVHKSATAFRNLPKLCSFWLNGACKRVERGSCPFRPCCGPTAFVFPEIAGSDKELHAQLCRDLTTRGPAAVQASMDPDVQQALQRAIRGKGSKEDAIKKRVAGTDDLSAAYARKIESKRAEPLVAPTDLSIKTLWFGGVDATVVAPQEVAGACEVYGTVARVDILPQSRCAFVEFESREAAEAAAIGLRDQTVLGGARIDVNWARGAHPGAASTGPLVSSDSAKDGAAFDLPPPPGATKRAVATSASGAKAPKARRVTESPWDTSESFKPVDRQSSRPYPSMNPMRMGSSATSAFK